MTQPTIDTGYLNITLNEDLHSVLFSYDTSSRVDSYCYDIDTARKIAAHLTALITQYDANQTLHLAEITAAAKEGMIVPDEGIE